MTLSMYCLIRSLCIGNFLSEFLLCWGVGHCHEHTLTGVQTCREGKNEKLSPAGRLTVSTQFLWFQISTFDKPRFPRLLILTSESPYLHSHLYFYPPLQLSHQDEHRQEDKTRLKIFRSCPPLWEELVLIISTKS